MKNFVTAFAMVLFVGNMMGNVERIETIVEVKEFQEGHELLCLSLAVFKKDSEFVVYAPILFVTKDYLSGVRLSYSDLESQFYVVMHRTKFPIEKGKVYVVKRGDHRPRQIGDINRESFEYTAEHGVLHYQINRDLVLNHDFLSHFGISLPAYEPEK